MEPSGAASVEVSMLTPGPPFMPSTIAAIELMPIRLLISMDAANRAQSLDLEIINNLLIRFYILSLI